MFWKHSSDDALIPGFPLTAVVTYSYLFDFGPFPTYLLSVLKLFFFLTSAWSQKYLLLELGFFCHSVQIAICSPLYEKNSSRELDTVASTFAKPDCKWEVIGCKISSFSGTWKVRRKSGLTL